MAKKTALFKNTTQTTVLLDSEKFGVHGKRVLPGSQIELPVEFGRTLRKLGMAEVESEA